MVPARTLKGISAKARQRACLLLLACMAAVAVVGCQREAGAPEPARSAAERAAQAHFDRQAQAWRAQRREDLLAPEGWTSLVGLHWIEPGPHYVGSAPGNGIRIALGPAEFGMLALEKDGRVRLVPAKGAGLERDGAALTGPVVLRTDQDEGGPDQVRFDGGKGVATVIRRGDRYALRVRHADAPTRTGFTRLDYWPADRGWAVPARYVANPPGTTLPIANIVGTVEPVPNPGAVEFERDGRRYRIQALDEGDGELFLVFADRSNGHGSYPAGRFLDAGRPDAQGRVMLDFNRSYNPPCAFTAFATCPLPPAANRLALSIEAGEKAYHAQ